MDINDARLPSRFWAKVTVDSASGCWVWSAAVGADGYGHIKVLGRVVRAHRFAYAAVENLLDDHDLDHLCRNRLCVNPAHLEAVTRRENILRGVGTAALNARKTSCVHGHDFTPENIYSFHGGRSCRICRREASRRRRARMRAA